MALSVKFAMATDHIGNVGLSDFGMYSENIVNCIIVYAEIKKQIVFSLYILGWKNHFQLYESRKTYHFNRQGKL